MIHSSAASHFNRPAALPSVQTTPTPSPSVTLTYVWRAHPELFIRASKKLPSATREGIQTDSSDEDDNEDEEPEEAVPALAAGVGLGGEEGSDAARAADARRRAANAALARLTASQHRPAAAVAGGAAGAADAAAVSAPPEEAGRDASIEEEEEEKEEVEVEVDLEGLTEIVGEPGAKLLVAVGVRTPGQLADRDEEELARELAVLQEQQQKQQQGETGVAAEPAGGGGGSSSSSSTEEEHRIDAEQVSEWVQSARGNELDEIMADIVGEDEDIVEVRVPMYISKCVCTGLGLG